MIKFKLNTFHLKIIAMIAMVIDHVGYILLPQESMACAIARLIGRISAPIFMYCLTVSLQKTSNRCNYIKRLFVASLLMMIINCCFMLLPISKDLTISVFEPNMIFTFFLAAVSIDCVDKFKQNKKALYLIFAILLCLLIGWKAEGGIVSIVTILSFYFIKKEQIRNICFVVLSLCACIAIKNLPQMFMILAILPIQMCTDEKPKINMKYFFYVFYPLHFAILLIIKQLMM